MRKIIVRFAIPFSLLLAVPFIYNSCQGHLLGGSMQSASSSSSNSCHAGLERGVVTKLSDLTENDPFKFQKVILRNPGSKLANVKAQEGPLLIKSGTELAVTIDNKCLQDNAKNLDQTIISKALSLKGELFPQFTSQVYLWRVEKDYLDTEINEQANLEPCVIGISWNYRYKAQTSFNDSSYIYQTQLQQMHAQDAYDKFYKTNGGMAKSSGTPVILATLDTGVDWHHPDLSANMWTHSQGTGIDIPSISKSTVSYDPMDVSSNGHGTHVSGIMAAVANNNTGVVGTMPFRAKIMGVKIFDIDGTGEEFTSSQFMALGINFATLNGASVINISVGETDSGPNMDSTILTAINKAVTAGVVVVLVIGNGNNGPGELIDGNIRSETPGGISVIPGVIGVGSYDVQTGKKSAFSNYSTTYAEIGGPGASNANTGILSTLPNGNYGYLAGTSQAAPAVSAAAGLAIGLIREAYGIKPTPAEVERLLLKSAVKNSQLVGYFKDGNQLDLLNLVNLINHDYPRTVDLSASSVLPTPCN